MKIAQRKELVFLLKFFAIFAFAEAFIFLLDFSALENFIASSSAYWLGLASSGNLVFVPDGIFEINPQCLGLVSGSVLAAIIFSLKKPEILEKTVIFLCGFALLLVLNYLRILLVILSGKTFGIEAGGIVHIASWFTTAALVLGLWYYFTKKLTGARSFSGFL